MIPSVSRLLKRDNPVMFVHHSHQKWYPCRVKSPWICFQRSIRRLVYPRSTVPLPHLVVTMSTQQQFRSFEDMVSSRKRCLVDFHSYGCGPCLMLAPILEELGKEYSQQLTIFKVDTDKYAALASQYYIRALPTLILFENGKEVTRWVGLLSKRELVDALQPFLS
ncbi:Thioredoxin-like protein slr0233 [Galdieria sulphuraria]|uniref:Thioredoxin n=1 Tax=Galdieria sulphuraria TaxID=130081 RepID=M2VX23_GALSU|nr:thioredoxin [Galdieria sulphuraria]EME27801.1 thioredoxin [Galdieria sulphuraria]GJD05780.1 Thioredoxin-like protein slr0233 [Galdieria sulphuraria]|eukprot:XP_005704321.1 thioredoxin [Galdieria sulphuraria]